MMWWAVGSLVMVAVAASTAGVMLWRAGYEAGYEAKISEMAENRARHRREERAAAGKHVRQRLGAFPGDDELFERKPADTGELRELSAMAEGGELDRIKAENAAFFRTWDLRQWTRKREDAA